jgi:hypothetical protein
MAGWIVLAIGLIVSSAEPLTEPTMSAHAMLRVLAVLLFALVVSAPAHARVFVSLGFPFFPFYWGPTYYYPPPPAYYYPPPYYYPPQGGYAPPGYSAPQSSAAPQGYGAPNAYAQNAPESAPSGAVSPSASKTCRTYHGDATIDSSGRPFYGRACLESDGRWHVQ